MLENIKKISTNPFVLSTLFAAGLVALCCYPVGVGVAIVGIGGAVAVNDKAPTPLVDIKHQPKELTREDCIFSLKTAANIADYNFYNEAGSFDFGLDIVSEYYTSINRCYYLRVTERAKSSIQYCKDMLQAWIEAGCNPNLDKPCGKDSPHLFHSEQQYGPWCARGNLGSRIMEAIDEWPIETTAVIADQHTEITGVIVEESSAES